MKRLIHASPGFGRGQRLLNAAEFRATFQNSQCFKMDTVWFYVKKNQLGHARLGLVVQKKRVPQAVMRNKLKRVLREHFRHRQTQLQGMDIVVRVNRDCDKTTYPHFKQGLEQRWSRLVNAFPER